MEELYNGIEANIKLLYEKSAKSLLTDNGINIPNPEDIARVQNSIKIMGELLNKGTEIHLALNAPDDIKKDFPDSKNLLGAVKEIKQLSDGVSD